MDIVSNKIGEVIESSSGGFTAQCYQLDEAPPLGALLKVNYSSGNVYGVVCFAGTHSLEPGRRIIARGEDADTEDSIYQQNPQIKKLLTTDFQVSITGYLEGEKIFHYLPPKAVPLHSFVYYCSDEEVKAFTQSLDFFRLLVDAHLPISCDEIIAACIRSTGQAYSDPLSFRIRAGRELATLLGGDTNRLNSILARLRL
jgi:hypothetical protein